MPLSGSLQVSSPRNIGERGVFAVAVLSGLADVDAVTLSIARMPSERSAADATLAILVAVAANTASKSAIAAYLGGRAFGGLVGIVNLVAVIAMFVAYLFLPTVVCHGSEAFFGVTQLTRTSIRRYAAGGAALQCGVQGFGANFPNSGFSTIGTPA